MIGKNPNARITRLIKGIPAVLYTDSFGDILTVEKASNVEDYTTRNDLYNLDKVVYEKFINGGYEKAELDTDIIAVIKGNRPENIDEIIK